MADFGSGTLDCSLYVPQVRGPWRFIALQNRRVRAALTGP
jgi:hypothetical protein